MRDRAFAEKGPSEAAPRARVGGPPFRPSSRWLWRGGAAVLLVAVVAGLAWGAFKQAARPHPFHAADFASWLLQPMPHPGYGEAPVVPAGTAGAFVPRGLCPAGENACAGLEVDPTGRALLRTEGALELISRVRHLPGSGNLVVVSAKGELWQLANGAPPAWRRAELPSLEGADGYGSGGSSGSWGNEAPASEPHPLQTLTGSGALVNAAAFSPDGARVITASEDGTARLWDLSTGAVLAVLGGHDGAVRSAVFSPDGARIVTASADHAARIWDSSTGAALAVLKGHAGAVTSAAFSPDGARVVTASEDGTVRLWDPDSGATTLVVEGHGAAVWSVAFSPDGARLVTASEDGAARTWEAQTGAPLLRLDGSRPITSAAFSPDGRYVVTASSNARIWDAAAGTEMAVLGSSIHAAEFSPDGKRIVSAGRDGAVRLWDVASASMLEIVENQRHWMAVLDDLPMNWIASARFSPDGSRVVTAHQNAARVWAAPPLSPVVTDIAPDGGERLWIVGRNGIIGQLGANAATPSEIGTEVDLLAIAAVGPGRAVAVGTGGLVVSAQRSGDSGEGQVSEQEAQQQATQQQAQAGQQEQEIVPGAGRGVIATVAGPLEAAAGRDLRAVQFLDEQRGWIAGDGGLLLHTADGGATWRVLHAGGGYALTDVHVQENGLGWAVGAAPDGRRVLLVAEDAAQAESWAELPHHLAAWWFLLGTPALVLAGFVNVRAWRREPPLPESSIRGAATSDRPLSWSDPDARVLRPLARGLSRFLRNVSTEPPLTIAITGRWGSGKSSLMNLLKTDLERHGARAVSFNAWHHREEEHLLAALFAAVRRQAPPPWWLSSGLAFRLRLLWVRVSGTVIHLGWVLLFAAIVFGVVRLSLPELDLQALLAKIAGWLGAGLALPEVAEEHGATVLGSGVALLLALWLRAKMVALPADPAKLAAALARRASLGDFSEKLSFRDRFGEQFREVCGALRTRRSAGLVILVDDLDRCQPEDTLKVLEAVNYFVSAGPCVVVLGMDRRQVEHCVGLGFEKLVDGLPDDELIYDDELVYDDEGRVLKAAKQRAFARHYLEKLINIEVPVPALTAEALEAMLLPGGQGGVAAPHAPEPLRWLERFKTGIRTGAQAARVGVLACVLAVFLTWGIEQVSEWPAVVEEPPAADATPKESEVRVSPPTNIGTAVGAPVVQERAPATAADLARISAPERPLVSDLPAERRWVWWSPTVLVLLVAALWGIGAFARREQQVVEDSPDFRKALAAVRPLLEAVNPTPRAIKRYQNRMRYLAERLRPQVYQPDAIDAALRQVGRWLRRPLVPEAWFADMIPPHISEPSLILLGAVEVLAPRAFEQPAEQVLPMLDREPAPDRTDRRACRRREAWRRVKQEFERRFPEQRVPGAWPSVADVRLYQTFVRAGGREDTVPSDPPGPSGDPARRIKPHVVAPDDRRSARSRASG